MSQSKTESIYQYYRYVQCRRCDRHGHLFGSRDPIREVGYVRNVHQHYFQCLIVHSRSFAPQPDVRFRVSLNLVVPILDYSIAIGSHSSILTLRMGTIYSFRDRSSFQPSQDQKQMHRPAIHSFRFSQCHVVFIDQISLKFVRHVVLLFRDFGRG